MATTDARRRKPGPEVVVASAVAIFLAVFALLAWQMRTGRDPALGTKPVANVVVPAKRRVLVRKVVVTRRVIVLRHDAAVTVQAPAPRVSTTYAAPPPVPVAPAPAPAPVVATHSS